MSELELGYGIVLDAFGVQMADGPERHIIWPSGKCPEPVLPGVLVVLGLRWLAAGGAGEEHAKPGGVGERCHMRGACQDVQGGMRQATGQVRHGRGG